MKIPQYDRKQGLGSATMPAWQGTDRQAAALESLAREVEGAGAALGGLLPGVGASLGQSRAAAHAAQTPVRPGPARDPGSAANLKEDARQVAQAAATYRSELAGSARQAAESGVGGFKRFEAAHARTLETLGQDLPVRNAEAFAALAKPVYAQARKQVLRAEQSARREQTHAGLAAQVQASKAQVAADPGAFAEAAASLEAGYALAAGAGVMGKEQMRAELNAHRRDLASDALAAKARLNPDMDLAKELGQPEYGFLAPAERKAAEQRAVQEAKLARIERKRGEERLAARIRETFEAEAAHRFLASGDEGELLALAGRLEGLGRSHEAAQCRRRLPVLRAGRDLLADTAAMPLAERLEHAARKAEQPGSADAAKLAQAELRRDEERLRKDPAAFMRAEARERLAHLRERGVDAERPEHAPIRASLEAQQEAGRGLEGFVPRILTRTQRRALAWGFARAGGVEQSLGLVQQLVAATGEYAGAVAREAELPLAVQLAAELAARSGRNAGTAGLLLRAQALNRPFTADESAVASQAKEELGSSPVFEAMHQAHALIQGGPAWRRTMDAMADLLAKASALDGSAMCGRDLLERAFTGVSEPGLCHVALPGVHDPDQVRAAARKLLERARQDHPGLPRDAALVSKGPGWDELAVVRPGGDAVRSGSGPGPVFPVSELLGLMRESEPGPGRAEGRGR